MRLSIPLKKSLLDSAIPFSKYSGCGNDFILIDNRKGVFVHKKTDLISSLCNRQFGIGADGVILLEESDSADWRMRIFNPDSSEAEMCGNGLRCLGRFLRELGIPGNTFQIEVMGKIYPLALCENQRVMVRMGPPTQAEWNIELRVNGKKWLVDFLNTGVPHAILQVNNALSVDLEYLGAKFRYHPQFAPHGANINFFHQSSQTPFEIFIRTFERGVERETLACGTGATACAIVNWKKYGHCTPIRTHFSSGEWIDFDIQSEGGEIQDIVMTGPAEFIFRGHISI